MRFYSYTDDDKMATAYVRCRNDAENGRAWLALMRLEDLREQFPGDPHLDYAEALLRLEFLGQGLQAQELCWNAYLRERRLAEALCNSVKLSPSSVVFEERAMAAQRDAPRETGVHELIAVWKQMKEDGEPYWAFLLSVLGGIPTDSHFGERAALCELILASGGDDIPPPEYAKYLRLRGECLRSLDRAAESRLRFLGESFLPEERLPLLQAVIEFEHNMADPYFRSAETLNLCASWCMLLNRHEDAIAYADQAIDLGGEDYLYPHRNKALALWGLGRKEESIELSTQTLEKAARLGDEIQAQEIRAIIEHHRNPPPSRLSDLRPLFELVLSGAGDAAFSEITAGKGTLEGVGRHFSQRAMMVGFDWSPAYVPLIAEMLAFFSPEAAHFIILKAAENAPASYQTWVEGNARCAAHYLAAHGTGVIRRDAARLRTIQLLAARDEQPILDLYRLQVRDISAAADGPLSEVADLIKGQVSRIHSRLTAFLEDQPPITAEDLRRAEAVIRERFSIQPEELRASRWWRPSPSPRQAGGPGCASAVVALLLAGLSRVFG